MSYPFALPAGVANSGFNSNWGLNNPTGPIAAGMPVPAQGYVPPVGQGWTSIENANAGSLGNIGGQGKGWLGIEGLGKNLDTAKLGLTGVATLGNLWGAFQAQKLAKQQFGFTKEITNTNLNNQLKSYNTALEDKARSRGVAEGQSQADITNYIEKNKMTRG